MPAWDPNVVESKLITPGPMRVGSQLQQLRRQGKRVMTCGAQVIEHKPYSDHAVCASIMGLQATFAYNFQPEGSERTCLKVCAKFEGKGFTKLFEGLIGRMCEKVDNDMLDRIASAMHKDLVGLKV